MELIRWERKWLEGISGKKLLFFFSFKVSTPKVQLNLVLLNVITLKSESFSGKQPLSS